MCLAPHVGELRLSEHGRLPGREERADLEDVRRRVQPPHRQLPPVSQHYDALVAHSLREGISHDLALHRAAIPKRPAAGLDGQDPAPQLPELREAHAAPRQRVGVPLLHDPVGVRPRDCVCVRRTRPLQLPRLGGPAFHPLVQGPAAPTGLDLLGPLALERRLGVVAALLALETFQDGEPDQRGVQEHGVALRVGEVWERSQRARRRHHSLQVLERLLRLPRLSVTRGGSVGRVRGLGRVRVRVRGRVVDAVSRSPLASDWACVSWNRISGSEGSMVCAIWGAAVSRSA